FRVGVLAFPFAAGSLDAAGGDAGPVLPEEPHAPSTVQVTASTATLLRWLPRSVFRLPLAFMVAPPPRRRPQLRFAAYRELALPDAREHPGWPHESAPAHCGWPQLLLYAAVTQCSGGRPCPGPVAASPGPVLRFRSCVRLRGHHHGRHLVYG